MMGSLRNPAGWNNVFGFRPSYGLVANGGPGDMFLAQLSTDGPMARSIRDLELLLAIQSEHDPRHPHSSGSYRPQAPGRKLRIGRRTERNAIVVDAGAAADHAGRDVNVRE